MGYTNDELNYVYDKTGGYCHYCGKKLAWKNYGQVGERCAWEVDHSVPKVLGGTDYLRNLWPACISCNRSKGTMTGPDFERQFIETGGESELSLGDVLFGIGAAILIGSFISATIRR